MPIPFSLTKGINDHTDNIPVDSLCLRYVYDWFMVQSDIIIFVVACTYYCTDCYRLFLGYGLLKNRKRFFMSELTEYLRYKRQSKWIYIASAVIVVVLLFALFKGCQKSKQAIATAAENKAKADSLTTKMKDDSVAMKSLRERYFQLMTYQEIVTNEKALIVDSFNKELNKNQSTVTRLIKQIRYYKEGMPDETFISVHPKYIQNCDSLTDKAEEQNVQIDGLQFEVKGLSESMKKEIALRDTALAKERIHSDTLQLRATLFNNLYNAANTANSPRNRIYMTGTVWSDLTRFGAGGGFTLVTKKQKVWGAKVGVFNKQLFYQADFGTLLSFRR